MSDSIQFRFHRGSLNASMSTVRRISTGADLVEALNSEGWAPGKIDVKPYGFDDRIGWDTYIVTVDGQAAGFTDGPLPQAQPQEPSYD